MKRRILSCLLAFTMTLGLFTVPTMASPEDIESNQIQLEDSTIPETEAEAELTQETKALSEAVPKSVTEAESVPETNEKTSINQQTNPQANEKTDTNPQNDTVDPDEETFLLDGTTGYEVLANQQNAADQPNAADPSTASTPQTAISLLSDGDCPTPEEAYQRMIALKDQYPEGMRWTNDNYYAWKGGYYTGGYGCAGFAMLLSDAAFGDLPSRRMTNITIDDVHPGDYMRINNDTHSVMVMQVYPTYIVIAEGNFNSSIHWGRRLSADEVANADYILTRYPLGYFGDYYMVNFDGNGSTSVIDSIGAYKNNAITIPYEIPEKAGHDFLGWSTNPNATSASFVPGDAFTPSENITLYAVWQLADLPKITSFPANVTAMIDQGGDTATFFVCPDEDGIYKFIGKCSSDSIASLYNLNGEEIAFDDDSGENSNFLMEANLQAGETYILVVYYWNYGTTGELPFTVTKTVTPQLTGPFPQTLSVTCNAENKEQNYYFTPSETASYTFESTGNADTMIDIYDFADSSYVAGDDDGGDVHNFKLTVTLTKNKKYLIVFSTYNNVSGSFQVNVTGGSSQTTSVRIVNHPEDVPAAIGDKITFSVTAENASTYQWQYSKDGGATWINSTVSSAKTPTISLTVSKTNYLNIYRCYVVGNQGTGVHSHSAEIAIIPWAEITAQPESPAMIKGETVAFVCQAENAASYQWQYSKDGTTWKNSTLSSATTNRLSIKVSDTNSMNIYRCKVTGMDGKAIYSNKAVFVMLTQQPEPCTAPIGKKASYTIKAENAASYQWQYSKDGGLTWKNSTLTSAKTDTLTFTVAESNMENLYRCKMKTTTGVYAYTKPVGYEDALVIVEQPRDVNAKAGATVTFNVVAAGKTIYFQWQYSKDNGKTWITSTVSSAKTPDLKTTVQASFNGRLYRCVVTDIAGHRVVSDSAKLTVG